MVRARLFAYALGVALLPVLLGLSSAACDSEVILPDGDGGAGVGGDGVGLIPTNASSTQTGSNPTNGGVGGEYVDPPCKDQPPPIEDFQCNPYAQGNGDCFEGEGCYIYVQYPPEPCGQEIYGAYCIPAGFGQQGDPCQGAQDCGAGLACVVTGSGTQCVELCPLNGPSGCPAGLVCEPIDVDGFGGCL